MTDQGRIDELNRENARLAAGLYLCAEQMRPQYDTTQSREKIARLKKMVKNDTATALDDLLEPVVELLEAFEELESRHCWHAGGPYIAIDDKWLSKYGLGVQTQLTRLRAVMGKEKE